MSILLFYGFVLLIYNKGSVSVGYVSCGWFQPETVAKLGLKIPANLANNQDSLFNGLSAM